MPLIGTFIVPHPPLIIPEVGKGQEKEIQKTIDAYEEVGRRIGELKPDTIIITTPHSVIYSDYLHISPGEHAVGDFKDFGAPKVHIEVDYDITFAQRLTAIAEDAGIPAGMLGERNKLLDHATLVPLYFVNKYHQDYKIVRVSLSGLLPLTHYRFGKCIAKAAQETQKRILIIAAETFPINSRPAGLMVWQRKARFLIKRLPRLLQTGIFCNF